MKVVHIRYLTIIPLSFTHESAYLRDRVKGPSSLDCWLSLCRYYETSMTSFSYTPGSLVILNILNFLRSPRFYVCFTFQMKFVCFFLFRIHLFALPSNWLTIIIFKPQIRCHNLLGNFLCVPITSWFILIISLSVSIIICLWVHTSS